MRSAQYYTIKTKKRRLKTGRLLFLLVLCAFLVLLAFSVRFLGMLRSISDHSAWASSLPRPEESQREHFLLYSVSNLDAGGCVTGVMLLAYHPDKHDFRAIQLPLNTLIEAEGPQQESMRLEDVYAAGGREMLVGSVAHLLGVPIHSYIEFREDFIPKAVDLLDATYIGRILGVQSGGDVLTLIHDINLSYSERLEKRRLVLAAIAAQVTEAGLVSKIRKYLDLSPLIRTNLSWRRMLSLMDQYKSMSYQDIVYDTMLPGIQEVGAEGTFLVPSEEEVAELMDWFGGDISNIPRGQITIEVLNGSGVAGMASKAADFLRGEGFNVIRVGNADSFNYKLSLVINRKERNVANEVAVLIPNSQLVEQIDRDSDVYVTVIIGEDYTLR